MMAAPKTETLLILEWIKKYELARVTHSDTTMDFSLQSAEQNSFITGQCSFRSGDFCIVKCFFSICVFKSFLLFFFSRFIIE